jgi:RNA polymerase sigma factor (TIGR02999 family)
MTQPSGAQITQLLLAWGGGDECALEQLMPLVYHELRRAARHQMGHQRPNHTLQATALVNEVYLRLVNFREVNWQDRAHFLAVCAKMMRRILVDFARSRQYQKRGGGKHAVSLEEALVVSKDLPGSLLAVDDALNALAAFDPRKSQVVELRFFGGLSIKQTSEALKVSEETVQRDWRLAKLWLLHELRGEKRDGA